MNGQILRRSLTPVVTTAATRPNGAVAAIHANQLLRFTLQVRAKAHSNVTDTPTLEVLDATTGQSRGSAIVLEGPLSTQIGTTRVNVAARTMAVDASGSTPGCLHRPHQFRTACR